MGKPDRFSNSRLFVFELSVNSRTSRYYQEPRNWGGGGGALGHFEKMRKCALFSILCVPFLCYPVCP